MKKFLETITILLIICSFSVQAQSSCNNSQGFIFFNQSVLNFTTPIRTCVNCRLIPGSSQTAAAAPTGSIYQTCSCLGEQSFLG